MNGGVFVCQSFQLIEHGRHVARQTQHVGPGCSGTTSFLSCYKAMVQWHQRRPVKTAVDPQELARRYRDGASLDDLGVLCGCSGKRIRRILAAQGVEIRPRGYNSDCRPNKFMRR
jgi:hypothetical protein